MAGLPFHGPTGRDPQTGGAISLARQSAKTRYRRAVFSAVHESSYGPKLTCRRSLFGSASDPKRTRGTFVSLPGEFRSILAWVRLNELLVNPSATIVTAPYATANEPPRNGSPWNNDRPQVPETRPSWHCFRGGFCVARHSHISGLGSHSFAVAWSAAMTGLGRGRFEGTKRPLIAQYTGATVAICATCSHARPL